MVILKGAGLCLGGVTWPAVVGGVSAPCCQTVVRRCRRPECRNHLHYVGQHHVARTDGAAAFQDRTVGLLLYVQVRFDRNRPPAAHGIDGDLLVVGAEEGSRSCQVHLSSAVGLCGVQGRRLTSGCRPESPACTGPPPAPPAAPFYYKTQERAAGSLPL